MPSDPRAPLDVHLLTTDALLAELVGGGAVSIAAGQRFTLSSDDARAVLHWYGLNRTRWTSNLSASDADAVVDAIGSTVPTVEAQATSRPSGTMGSLRLVKVVAHRFAGLHAYGSTLEAPETFVFEPSKGITLLEGVNGSGKTSILNAVVWCLTGHLIRSQRMPEEGPTEFLCDIARDGRAPTTHPMSTITPMPPTSEDLGGDGQAVPADTWVEVTLADAEGDRLPPLRRSQSRTLRGKITETPPDLDAVGIDPISWRIATIMPALLQFLPVGSTSQLGEAVARLTGLADLVDLARHADKMSDRIAKRAVPELKKQCEEIAERYDRAVADLYGIVGERPAIAFEGTAPAVDAGDAGARITEIARKFLDLKTEALSEAQTVLGESFNPEEKAARDDLEASIRPAIEQLKRATDLPSIARLRSLSVTADDADIVTSMLDRIEAEAATLARLFTEPDRARRSQLYARVAAWMHEHSHADGESCPVCNGKLEGACDPVTGDPVSMHLSEAALDRDVIARTVIDWAASRRGLLQELPTAIVGEARADLPASPAALLKRGLIDELFATEPFDGVLVALRDDATALVDAKVTALPGFVEPKRRVLPAPLATDTVQLQVIIDRVIRAHAFAQWRGEAANSLNEVLHAFRRGDDGEADAGRAIGRRLASLLRIVEGTVPLNGASEQTRRMEVERQAHAAKRLRIERCGRAVEALDALVPLGNLAQAQVETLRRKLHGRSEQWRRAVYRNATTFAPDLTETGMNARGVLELKVGRDGVAAPAQHVSNASALRGALMGFFLAFREHVLATRGGLSLLIFDDPQELLDHDNRQRLARGLSGVAKADGQLLVTTHDRRFAQSLVAESRLQDGIQHLSVHPVNHVRPTLRLSPAIEEVDRRRQALLASPDSAIDAQNYASDVRVFLEARLGDLFDDLAEPAHAASTRALTLIPLVDKLRALIANGAGELFRSAVLKQFVDDGALAEGADTRRVLNTSHHDKASLTYMDVKAVAADFQRLRTSVEKIHEQFRLHRWREPLATAEPSAGKVMSLRPMTKPAFAVPLCPDIAAFVGDSHGEGSQEIVTEALSGNWFDSKALFYIRGHSLGFAIPSGAVAVVEAEPYSGRDQNLVIAQSRGQVLARRLVKSPGSLGVSLSALMPDPRTARPTATFDESKVRLYRIVGVIFTDMAPPPGGGEATPVDALPELARIKVAYRVREESAVPLALPDQIILGGSEISPAELDGWEGRLAAVTLADGMSILKRVGTRLPGSLGHLRQFETIGGLGSSMVIATEVVEGHGDVPLMASARRVLGVLYEDG